MIDLSTFEHKIQEQTWNKHQETLTPCYETPLFLAPLQSLTIQNSWHFQDFDENIAALKEGAAPNVDTTKP